MGDPCFVVRAFRMRQSLLCRKRSRNHERNTAPEPTLSLPQGCGMASPLTANGSEAALDHPDHQLRRACAEQQQARLARARGPVPLEYRLKGGREGRDGYYERAS